MLWGERKGRLVCTTPLDLWAILALGLAVLASLAIDAEAPADVDLDPGRRGHRLERRDADLGHGVPVEVQGDQRRVGRGGCVGQGNSTSIADPVAGKIEDAESGLDSSKVCQSHCARVTGIAPACLENGQAGEGHLLAGGGGRDGKDGGKDARSEWISADVKVDEAGAAGGEEAEKGDPQTAGEDRVCADGRDSRGDGRAAQDALDGRDVGFGQVARKLAQVPLDLVAGVLGSAQALFQEGCVGRRPVVTPSLHRAKWVRGDTKICVSQRTNSR